eukprot:2257235-Rhodomonas_salina.2
MEVGGWGGSKSSARDCIARTHRTAKLQQGKRSVPRRNPKLVAPYRARQYRPALKQLAETYRVKGGKKKNRKQKKGGGKGGKTTEENLVGSTCVDGGAAEASELEAVAEVEPDDRRHQRA